MIWKILFVFGVLAFAIMSVWVTIAGANDIKKLFKDLNKEHHQNRSAD